MPSPFNEKAPDFPAIRRADHFVLTHFHPTHDGSKLRSLQCADEVAQTFSLCQQRHRTQR